MNSNPLNYQIIDHTADLGIIVEGADEIGLFIPAAYAMTDLLVKAGISFQQKGKMIAGRQGLYLILEDK
jgi:SHS2 domain-containing protein